MKILLLLFFTFLSSIYVYPQNSINFADWQKLESESKEVSFYLPKDFYVLNELKSADKEIDLNGYLNGVTFEINISKEPDGKQRLDRINPNEKTASVSNFSLQKFKGKIILSNTGFYHCKIYVAGEKFFYVFKISSSSADSRELHFFLQTLKLADNSIFTNPSQSFRDDKSSVVSFETLQTSSEAASVLKSKVEKTAAQITVKKLSEYSPAVRDTKIRPAFILTEIKPNFGGGRPANGILILEIQLLPTGQVGEIIAYSDIDKTFVKNFAKAAKDLRFIPAKLSGNYTESWHIDSANIGSSTVLIPSLR